MKLRIAIIALLFSALAQATPITLQVTFTVESFIGIGGGPAPSLATPILVGDKFFASILVDDSILATDGPSNPGKVLAFHARMGASVWDPNLPRSHPSPIFGGPSPDGTVNDFLGFRGPCYNPALSCTTLAQQLIWGLDSEFLGFEVENHQIVGLWGGVYGQGDAAVIDFLGDTFDATPWLILSNGSYTAGIVRGQQDIAVVASPGSLALLMLGLLIGWGRFRPLLDTR